LEKYALRNGGRSKQSRTGVTCSRGENILISQREGRIEKEGSKKGDAPKGEPLRSLLRVRKKHYHFGGTAQLKTSPRGKRESKMQRLPSKKKGGGPKGGNGLSEVLQKRKLSPQRKTKSFQGD